MKSSFTSFWWPGILSVILVALASRFQWLSRVEFVNDLISKSSIPGLIATLVLVVVLWGLISLYFRNNWATKELRIIAMSGFELGEATSLLGYIQKIETRFKGSLLQERFQLISQNLHDHNASDKVSTLLGGQSGVDSAHIHSGYGPLRALVWALPGLGFMGTAYEMAASIGGLGTALTTTQDYSGLRNLLVSNVVPHLAGAFDITLFALGSSVLMFLLLSLVFHREERAVFEADTLCLKVISRIQDAQAAPGNIIGQENLSGDMRTLSQQLNLLSSALSQINQDNSSLYRHLESINTNLSNIQQKVGELKNSVDKDQEVILRRVSR
ncbi:MAG: hypothetical protein IPM31_06495 [Anaerolineae bacterium]|nr:hypothetical protein [Anaerolineae bacterium]MBL8105062.1 hypothetical protein [Anaerolineales bacterium]